MLRKLLVSAIVATVETVVFLTLNPSMRQMLLFLLVGGLVLFLTWEGLPDWVSKHQDQDDRPTGLGDIRPTRWEEGDPLPVPDFPITVRLDREPTLSAYSAVVDTIPQHRSNLYAILHGLTLTNVSDEEVVVLLELIIQRPNGRLVDVGAELDDPPPKAGQDGGPSALVDRPGGTQFRRLA